MQMFGIGILELLVILFLAVIVIGPDRIPSFAADLARWIRRTRAYAQHLTRDFSDVVSELEKEAGTSREDWKEIASLVTRHTGDLGREFERVGTQIERSTQVDLEDAKTDSGDKALSNVAAFEAVKTNGSEPEPEPAEETPAVEQPWYVPETSNRRRRPRP
jgi:sec-independent protein translocase protein TatB